LNKITLNQMLAQAKLHISQGEISEANAIYETLLQNAATVNDSPKSPEIKEFSSGQPTKVIIDQLIELYNSGDLQATREQATMLTKKYPNSYVIWNLLGASVLQDGQFDQAVSAFLKVIKINPNIPQAYNNLGTAYSNMGNLEEAIAAYRNALLIDPNYTDALNNIGQAFMKKSEPMEAIDSYERALSTNPNFYAAYYNLGLALSSTEQWEQAINVFNKAIVLDPGCADTYNDLGIALRALDNLEDAILSYNNAIALRPRFAEAYNNLGIALKEVGELEEARSALMAAIASKADYAEAHCNLGTVLKEQGNSVEALKYYEHAILIKPNYAEAYNNIGSVLREQGNLESALDSFQNAIAISPKHAEYIYNMGTVFAELGRMEEATEAYEASLAIKPDYPAANVNLGRVNWRKLNFKRGFELMEWRWSLGKGELYFGDQFDSVKPTWNGFDREEIFVWKEQGIGDEIMFSSMLLEISKKSRKIIVECDNRLLPLYKRSFPNNIKFINDRSQICLDDYKSHISIGSLPKYFRHSLEDFRSTSSGWLKADPVKVKSLREKICKDNVDKIIGVSWHTNSSGSRGQKRTIPLNTIIEHLKRLPANFISLQYGDTAEDIRMVNKDNSFNLITIDEIDVYNDIDGLAALIKACDVVVSIDNLTVHLAGALGVDTKVLLPEIAEERWGAVGSNSYWYDHLTLYRKEEAFGWEKQLELIVQDLTFQ
jgi:tetratricopeptide (TPR) repeat protein/ADP-heptose:LPS heptosyltransferase